LDIIDFYLSTLVLRTTTLLRCFIE